MDAHHKRAVYCTAIQFAGLGFGIKLYPNPRNCSFIQSLTAVNHSQREFESEVNEDDRMIITQTLTCVTSGVSLGRRVIVYF